MDVEAELIRSSNWAELKRYYSSNSGRSWELGWIHLLKSKDQKLAQEEFSKALNDIRYRDAAIILLWWLGRRPHGQAVEGPPSLKVYEAYISGNSSVLLRYLQEASAHTAYLSFLFQDQIDRLSLRELESLEKFSRPPSFALLLGDAYDRRWKDFEKARIFYEEFFRDPWTKNVISENRRQLFDAESSRKLRMFYAQKDVGSLRKVLLAIQDRNREASSAWGLALVKAIDWDLKTLNENATGYSFWKESELSPRALRLMREALFSKEVDPIPPGIQFWSAFFESPKLLEIPAQLDPDALSLWQIRVEMKPEVLSEALLRFPQQERFLFLWSLRQRERSKADPRRWPSDEKESSVVRKSLEKAFERATDKVLWFDRLRATGCSQDFYEYAIQRAAIPVRWVIEDLEKSFISNTPMVRAYLRDQLSISAPTESESHVLNPSEFLKAVSFLTPAEKQQVLLSRFVLSDIPPAILNEESLDLFFEARSRVSPEMFRRWQKIVLKFLGEKARRSMSTKDWRWVELAWETDAVALDRFSPGQDVQGLFPWETYLEKLWTHQKFDLILNALPRIPEERLKESWIRNLLDQFNDERLVGAAKGIQTDHIRDALLADIFERRGDFVRAIEFREDEMTSTPILNEQTLIAVRMIDLLKRLSAAELSTQLSHLESAHKILEDAGALDENSFRDLAQLYSTVGLYEKSYAVTVSQWSRAGLPLREQMFLTLLERAFQARAIDSAQRVLVDFVFENGSPQSLTYEVLNTLLEPESVFRLQHLRREFVERSSQLFPLHREVLKAKAAYDYRALLLWESFYGEPLDVKAQMPAYDRKRRYELWRFTESVSHVESSAHFARYLQPVAHVEKPIETKGHEFLDKAKRATSRLAKLYGIRKTPEIYLTEGLKYPFTISLRPYQIELRPEFFGELDEEMWASIALGCFQIFDDYQKGLFDERSLMERFFQGMLLSGAPIAKLIRLWVWLAISEGYIEPTLLKAEPEVLIEKLPFINALLIFYLGKDFDQKMGECALPLG